MNRLIASVVLSLSVLGTPVAFAAEAGRTIVAQNFDIQLGPGGGRERDYERRYEERREYGRPGYGERRFDRREGYEVRRFAAPRIERRYNGCRIVVIRRETPYGTRVRRVRTCG